MKRTIVLLALVFAACLVSPARASIILAQYAFDGSSASPTTQGTGVVASVFTDGAGVAGALNFDTTAGQYDPVSGAPYQPAIPSVYKTFSQLKTIGSSFTGSTFGVDKVPLASNTQFFAFNVSASTNYALGLDSLSFVASRGAANPVFFTTYYSTNSNFSSPTYVGQDSLSSATNKFAYKFDGLDQVGVPPQLYFRIYVNDNNDSDTSTARVRVDNVTLEGTSVPVPEPATMCMWAVGAGLAMVVGGVRKRLGMA
jgi:hypothetical protein